MKAIATVSFDIMLGDNVKSPHDVARALRKAGPFFARKIAEAGIDPRTIRKEQFTFTPMGRGKQEIDGREVEGDVVRMEIRAAVEVGQA